MTRHRNGGGVAPLVVHLAAASPAQHQPSWEWPCVEIIPAFAVSTGSYTTGSHCRMCPHRDTTAWCISTGITASFGCSGFVK